MINSVKNIFVDTYRLNQMDQTVTCPIPGCAARVQYDDMVLHLEMMHPCNPRSPESPPSMTRGGGAVASALSDDGNMDLVNDFGLGGVQYPISPLHSNEDALMAFSSTFNIFDELTIDLWPPLTSYKEAHCNPTKTLSTEERRAAKQILAKYFDGQKCRICDEEVSHAFYLPRHLLSHLRFKFVKPSLTKVPGQLMCRCRIHKWATESLAELQRHQGDNCEREVIVHGITFTYADTGFTCTQCGRIISGRSAKKINLELHAGLHFEYFCSPEEGIKYVCTEHKIVGDKYRKYDHMRPYGHHLVAKTPECIKRRNEAIKDLEDQLKSDGAYS
jgi:hypothetical protein